MIISLAIVTTSGRIDTIESRHGKKIGWNFICLVNYLRDINLFIKFTQKINRCRLHNGETF